MMVMFMHLLDQFVLANGCDGNVYAEGTENFITALACTELEGGLSPSQVGVGLPASTSAAGSGYVAPSVVNDALDCLAAGANCGSFVPPKTWPTIRGAMTWSINWDASNGDNFADSVAPYLVPAPVTRPEQQSGAHAEACAPEPGETSTLACACYE